MIHCPICESNKTITKKVLEYSEIVIKECNFCKTIFVVWRNNVIKILYEEYK